MVDLGILSRRSRPVRSRWMTDDLRNVCRGGQHPFCGQPFSHRNEVAAQNFNPEGVFRDPSKLCGEDQCRFHGTGNLLYLV